MRDAIISFSLTALLAAAAGPAHAANHLVATGSPTQLNPTARPSPPGPATATDLQPNAAATAAAPGGTGQLPAPTIATVPTPSPVNTDARAAAISPAEPVQTGQSQNPATPPAKKSPGPNAAGAILHGAGEQPSPAPPEAASEPPAGPLDALYAQKDRLRALEGELKYLQLRAKICDLEPRHESCPAPNPTKTALAAPKKTAPQPDAPDANKRFTPFVLLETFSGLNGKAAILRAPDSPPRLITVGERLAGGVEVVAIAPGAVTLSHRGERHYLRINP